MVPRNFHQSVESRFPARSGVFVAGKVGHEQQPVFGTDRHYFDTDVTFIEGKVPIVEILLQGDPKIPCDQQVSFPVAVSADTRAMAFLDVGSLGKGRGLGQAKSFRDFIHLI